MKRKVLFSLCIVALICNCCNEFNTATPQASSTIITSKENGFYLSTGNKLRTGELDIIDSVWIEKVWHYKVINGEKKKISLSSNNQVVLKLKKTNEEFKKNNYFLEWKIEEKHFGDLASGNGVFIMRYPNTTKIDTLHFLLNRLNNNSTTDIGTFFFPTSSHSPSQAD
ncbi:hypothetical protein ACKW6Q_12830 [Chryseobacterium kwangjuense]|uniref:Lipoprotein n=1 Tax=Chryseobacterium kwangjuense TaxID=267125 RepID=A0ABW9K3E0_9FLAO